jgi:hypothetical protein
VEAKVLVASGAAHEARNAALPRLSNLSASLRLRICPIGLSSWSIKGSFAYHCQVPSSYLIVFKKE